MAIGFPIISSSLLFCEHLWECYAVGLVSALQRLPLHFIYSQNIAKALLVVLKMVQMFLMSWLVKGLQNTRICDGIPVKLPSNHQHFFYIKEVWKSACLVPGLQFQLCCMLPHRLIKDNKSRTYQWSMCLSVRGRWWLVVVHTGDLITSTPLHQLEITSHL